MPIIETGPNACDAEVDTETQKKRLITRSYTYKDYDIVLAPNLYQSGEWGLQLYIKRHTDDAVTSKSFSGKNTFKTKEEAVYHCIEFGKQIIDGKIPTCTVSDL